MSKKHKIGITTTVSGLFLIFMSNSIWPTEVYLILFLLFLTVLIINSLFSTKGITLTSAAFIAFIQMAIYEPYAIEKSGDDFDAVWPPLVLAAAIIYPIIAILIAKVIWRLLKQFRKPEIAQEVEMSILDKLLGVKKLNIPPKEPIQNSVNLMETDRFWEIIQTSIYKGFRNYESRQRELRTELLKLDANDILEFSNTFRNLRGQVYNWDFWAAAYIINGGCSDDTFSDFRGWLIGQGRAIFEKAVEDIETLSDIGNTDDGNWEGLSYIASETYENKTGGEMPRGFRENTEISGEEWDEEGDDLKNRYPKLWDKFGME